MCVRRVIFSGVRDVGFVSDAFGYFLTSSLFEKKCDLQYLCSVAFRIRMSTLFLFSNARSVLSKIEIDKNINNDL